MDLNVWQKLVLAVKEAEKENKSAVIHISRDGINDFVLIDGEVTGFVEKNEEIRIMINGTAAILLERNKYEIECEEDFIPDEDEFTLTSENETVYISFV